MRVGVLLVIVTALSPGISAQTLQGRRLEFDVASVRPLASSPCNVNTAPLGLTRRISGNRLTIHNNTLAGLIREAYNVRDDQYSDLPAWASCTDQYEIEATAEGSLSADVARLMLQALLQDRFHLVAHHETKTATVYELHIAEDGFKLKLYPEQSTEHVNPWGLMRSLIEGNLDYPLVDKTGLSGFFDNDYVPKWDEAKLREERVEARREANLPPGVFYHGLAPSIFREIEKEGLTIKKATGPSDFLVIEHVERPSAN